MNHQQNIKKDTKIQDETQPSVKLRIPTPLRSFTQGKKTVVVRGKSVRETLQNLADQFPDIRHHLFEADGTVRNFVNVYLNEKDVRTLSGIDTPTSEGDEILLVPSVAGG